MRFLALKSGVCGDLVPKWLPKYPFIEFEHKIGGLAMRIYDQPGKMMIICVIGMFLALVALVFCLQVVFKGVAENGGLKREVDKIWYGRGQVPESVSSIQEER